MPDTQPPETSTVDRVVDYFGKLERVGSGIAMMAVFLIMALVTINVVSRRALETPISGANLIVILYLMPITVYFGIAEIESKEDHISVDLIADRLPETAKLWRNLFYKALMTVVLVAIVRGTTNNFLESYVVGRTTGGTIQFPVWVSDFIVPFGFGLLLLRVVVSLVYDIVDAVHTLREGR